MTARLRKLSAILLIGCLAAGCAAGTPSAVPDEATRQVSMAPSPTPFQPVGPTASVTPSPTVTVTPTPNPSPTPIPSVTPTITPPPEISIVFTGVIVPARCVQAAVDARGDANYIYAEVSAIIQSANLAVGTLNATLSDYPPHTGCVQTYVLVGSANNADAMQQAGFDAMSVATNHIKNCGLTDCGDRAFLETLDNLKRVGIQTVGAGLTHAEAIEPLVMTVKGIRFGIVSLGMVEPMAFAGENTPGIAILDEDNLRSAIAAARLVSDVVIAMPHWGPEDSSFPNEWQTRYAQVAAEAGADIVVGNHTHVVQAYQEINGIPIFYGLGNFVFDQTWDLGHQQGVILRLNFTGASFSGYEFIPTHVDGDGTVHLAGADEASQILDRIQQASEKLR